MTRTLLTLAGLLALMALTRTEYPGLSVILPDASWAVFLLAGFFLRQARYFVIFALAAWGLDIYAFRHDLAAVVLAFVISNLGYFLYSVYGESMSLVQYSLAVAKYLPMYLATTAAYTGLLSALATGVAQWRQARLAQV